MSWFFQQKIIDIDKFFIDYFDQTVGSVKQMPRNYDNYDYNR